IGTGAISTGIKRGVARAEAIDAAMKMMTTSAASAAEAMQAVEAHACTDVTGFGLLGHAYEMARASDVCLIIESCLIPLLPDVLDLFGQGMLTRGDKNNREYVGDTIEFAEGISPEMQSALFDPQTAGGLLISVKRSKADALINKIEGAVVIGEVQQRSSNLIQVI
ncbi:MAG: selenide, water dikinase SelD, partial [Acidobacteria bacterium]|nr:selenide, water dikinase SelD [Acidobacteriota bacterium]